MNSTEEGIIEFNLFRSKGKHASKEIYVEVKPSRRQAKWWAAETMPKNTQDEVPPPYNTITNDTWFHIAKHIEPEDVQTFALICRQTAEMVKSRSFWRHLYFKYCHKSISEQWTLKLPEHLQVASIRNCCASSLRCRVIELLFYSYTPFVERVRRGYCLDTLLGRTYTASWHLQCQCVWIMCYKFWNRSSSGATKAELPFADNWEALANDDEVTASATFSNPHEGVSILIIFCDRFIPFPTHILYGGSRVRLLAIRQLLAKDLCGSNLELDFVDSISKAITTVRYPQILKYKVIPWWHKDFRKFIK